MRFLLRVDFLVAFIIVEKNMKNSTLDSQKDLRSLPVSFTLTIQFRKKHFVAKSLHSSVIKF